MFNHPRPCFPPGWLILKYGDLSGRCLPGFRTGAYRPVDPIGAVLWFFRIEEITPQKVWIPFPLTVHTRTLLSGCSGWTTPHYRPFGFLFQGTPTGGSRARRFVLALLFCPPRTTSFTHLSSPTTSFSTGPKSQPERRVCQLDRLTRHRKGREESSEFL